ncbi:MAG: ArsR family transcriptional regulator [Haloglomus sp.]
MFEALSHPRRRRILTVLVEANPGDNDEFVPDDFTPTDGELDGFVISLHHNHLPRLHDAGFIEWEPRTETVRRGPRFDEIVPLVELMSNHENELPADWP